MIQIICIDGCLLNVNIGKVENWGVEVDIVYYIYFMWRLIVNYSWFYMEYFLIVVFEYKLYIGIDFIQKKWSFFIGI